MSLHPQEPPSVPDDTRRVAQAAFPNGTLCLHIAEALGPLYHDSQFAALFPRRGQPAEAPGLLALVTVLQFVEGLSDPTFLPSQKRYNYINSVRRLF